MAHLRNPLELGIRAYHRSFVVVHESDPSLALMPPSTRRAQADIAAASHNRQQSGHVVREVLVGETVDHLGPNGERVRLLHSRTTHKYEEVDDSLR